MSDLLWTCGIPVLQLLVALHTNKCLRFLSIFLYLEALGEIAVNIVARWAGDESKTYLYAWIGGVLLHHALCAYLLANIYSTVRRRGLPSRQSSKPLLFLTVAALALGFHFAKLSMAFSASSVFRTIVPLDHALSVALGCMIVVLPFYCLSIASSLHVALWQAFAGLAIYEFAYAGLLGKFIVSQHMDYPHAIDIVYIISLVVWFTALRIGRLEPPPQRTSNPQRNPT